MQEINSILVPVDFSERTSGAIEHAAAIASRAGAKLVFLHVVPAPPKEYASFWVDDHSGSEWPSATETQAYCAEQLQDLVRRLASEQDTEIMVLSGDASETICQVARDRKIDLIIMPTHSHGTYRRFLLGSNTAKVLHDARCPVLTGAHVEEGAVRGPEPYRHVACCVALDEESLSILSWAHGFSKLYGAQLTVIHAVPDFDKESAKGSDNYALVLRKSAEKQVDKLLQQIGGEAAVVIETGEIDKKAYRLLKRSDIDLLVIGRSREGTHPGRLRNHAYTLIRSAPCPVVSV